MRSKITSIAVAALLLSGCSGMGPKEATGTAIGGVAGAAIGGSSGSVVGAGVGAAAGGVVGAAVGRSADRQNFYYSNP